MTSALRYLLPATLLLAPSVARAFTRAPALQSEKPHLGVSTLSDTPHQGLNHSHTPERIEESASSTAATRRGRGRYYFGARYYDPRISTWVSADPLLDEVYSGRAAQQRIQSSSSLGVYSYANQNPIALKDPDGRDAIVVVFPDYKIATPIGRLPHLGHAGVVIVDPKTGYTRYYEYGRYGTSNGEVRRRRVPNLRIDPKTGKPTRRSLKQLFATLSRDAGQKGRVEGAYVRGADYEATLGYAKGRKEANGDPEREGYSLVDNNCGSFCLRAVNAGGEDTPLIVDPRPNSMIGEVQEEFGNRLSYDPKTKELAVQDATNGEDSREGNSQAQQAVAPNDSQR